MPEVVVIVAADVVVLSIRVEDDDDSTNMRENTYYLAQVDGVFTVFEQNMSETDDQDLNYSDEHNNDVENEAVTVIDDIIVMPVPTEVQEPPNDSEMSDD